MEVVMFSIRSACWPLLAYVCLACAARPIDAATLPITWLDISTVPVGGTIATGSVVNLPGYGNVLVTYTGTMNRTRGQHPAFQNCSVSSGGNSYPWTTLNTIDQVNFSDPPANFSQYTFQFTFLSGDIAAGQAVLEVHGLERVLPSWITTVTVYEQGFFLGDCNAGLGPTYFAGSHQQFTLYNSNFTDLNMDTNPGIIRIAGPILFGWSITLNVVQFGQDDIGFTVGLIADVPVDVQGTTWGRLKSLYR
jgi:hypothetical protein